VTLDPRALALQLEQRDPESRRIATQAIAHVRTDEAIALLLSALKDDDWRVRKEAAKVAPNVESRRELIVALVATLNEKENIGLRNAAVEALVAIGSDAVVPTAGALGHLDADGRKLAVEILGGIPDARAIETLANALSDEDLNVRAAAAEALGGATAGGEQAQEQAATALIRALSEGEPHMKLAVLNTLVRLGARVPWATLERFTSDPVFRRHAITAAGQSNEEAALLALADACGDASPGFAMDAIVALADRLLADHRSAAGLSLVRERVAASRRAVERVRAMANETDARIRGAALVVLGLLGDKKDVPVLVEALQDEPVTSRAELALHLLGSGAVNLVLEAGRTSEAPVRAATLSLVPLLSDKTEPFALEALREALGDANPEVLMAAMMSLSVAGGGEDLTAIAPYATSADSRIAGTARSALKALAHRDPASALDLAQRIDAHGPSAVVGCVLIGAVADGASANMVVSSEPRPSPAGARPTDVAFLRTALDHGDARVRHAAVVALASLPDPRAGDAVAFALADEDEEVVLAAVRSLGRMRRADPLLTLLRTTRNPGVLAATVLALGEASPNDAFEAAKPFLLSDPVLACAAVEAIGQLEGPRRVEGLLLALQHTEPEVVKAALVGLARGADEVGLAKVVEYLEDESFEVRRLAANLLGTEGSITSQARLRGRLERETDERVRDAIAEALSARTST
jgi:HEAT repeat protein